MQCPRCYFSNPAGTRICEYCGARLEGTTNTTSTAGSASDKRKTMLGPLPSAPPQAPKGSPPPIDPDDPFRIAAQGVGKTPSVQASSSPAPPPPPKVPIRQSVRPTLITVASTPTSGLAGVALVIPPNGEATAIVIREGRTRIGRRPDAEVRIHDPEASSDHAILRVEDGTAWLLDTSANGTLVSGVSCVNDRAEIIDGSVLTIGDTAIVLKLISSESLAHLAGMG